MRPGDAVKIGYSRVSTEGQELAAQVAALKAAGCEKVFSDKASGKAGSERAGLRRALAACKPGDVLAVWALDRLGRSLPELVLLLDGLTGQGVGFQSLRESIDTGTAAGRLQLHMLAALAEFERSRIAERTRAGLDAAKARGVQLGRPSKLSAARLAMARRWLSEDKTGAEVAHLLGVSRSTLYKRLAEKGAA